MNKTITIYELLGLVKDGKAPEKINYLGIEYKFMYQDYKDESRDLYLFSEEIKDITDILNDTVEIIEDNDKLEKINVKTGDNCKRFIEYDDETGHHKYTIRLLDEYFAKNINKIRDHINKIEEKLDER